MIIDLFDDFVFMFSTSKQLINFKENFPTISWVTIHLFIYLFIYSNFYVINITKLFNYCCLACVWWVIK